MRSDVKAHLAFENRADFLVALENLKANFDSTQPVLEITLRDPDLDVEGYIVVHNTKISLGGVLNGANNQGCGKGGTRIAPDVTLDDVRMLAHKMALKNAAAGLPMGGAKSALRGDPDSIGFEAKYKRFVEMAKPFLFENGGCFGGFGFDIGARAVHAVWACEVLGSRQSFTGKSLEMGGTDYDREGIAGLGVSEAALAALRYQGKNISTQKFAVQGAGAMGAAVIRYLSEAGVQLCAVCDPRLGGGWLLKNAPSDDLCAALSAMEFDRASQLLQLEAEKLEHMDDVLSIECDILCPCAMQNVITCENAHLIQARIIVEGANSPCSFEAYNIFDKNNVLVIPDFMANAGGIIAAFVELTQNSDGQDLAFYQTKTNEAKKQTRERISDNVKYMLDIAERYTVRSVDAGYYLALSRLLR